MKKLLIGCLFFASLFAENIVYNQSTVSNATNPAPVELSSANGNQVEVGAFGELRVAEPVTQVAVTFEYPLDEKNKVTKVDTGACVSEAQHNGSLLRLRTNGIGDCYVESKRTLVYTAGSTGGSYFTVSFHGTPTANTKQLIGLYDISDGIYLGYNGADFVVAYRNTEVGADTIVTSSNFNGNFDIANYLANDKDKIHRFRIKYGYLGVGDTSIEIKPNNDSRKWETVHTFKTDGALLERTHIGTPILPVRAEVSSTDATDVYITSGSWNAHSYAKSSQVQNTRKQDDGTITAESGTLAVYRVTPTFGGKGNKIQIKLLYADFGTGSEGLYKFVILKNPTVTGGTYTDLDTDVSVVQKNTTFTTVTNGERVYVSSIGIGSQGSGAGKTGDTLKDQEVFFRPGDIFAIIKEEIIAGAGNDANSYAISWQELK